MTQRERGLVISGFGMAEGAIGIVHIVTFLATGEISVQLNTAFGLVVVFSLPYAIPWIWHEWKDRKPTPEIR